MLSIQYRPCHHWGVWFWKGKTQGWKQETFNFFFLGSLWRECGTRTAVTAATPPLHQRVSSCTHTIAATTLEREPLQWSPSCARWHKVKISAAQLLIQINQLSKFLFVPGLYWFWVWGEKLSCESFWIHLFVFPNATLPHSRASHNSTFVWETTLGAVFGRHFCLFGGEWPFVGKTLSLSFVHSVINIVWVLQFFSKS